MDTVLWLCPSGCSVTEWNIKMAHPPSLPTLIQESFWWWQCSDRYISLPLPPTPYLLSPLSPSPILRYHVYLQSIRPWRARTHIRTHRHRHILFLLFRSYCPGPILALILPYWLTERKTRIYSLLCLWFLSRESTFLCLCRKKEVHVCYWHAQEWVTLGNSETRCLLSVQQEENEQT